MKMEVMPRETVTPKVTVPKESGRTTQCSGYCWKGDMLDKPCPKMCAEDESQSFEDR